jgi:capsular polysaccharide biosynthesis protein
MDPPSVTPKHIDLHSVVVKYGMEALAGIAVLEFVIIYVIGLRDPRVRSGEEVRKKLGVPYLGSTPDLRSAA